MFEIEERPLNESSSGKPKAHPEDLGSKERGIG
jgi:hypothetical protein